MTTDEKIDKLTNAIEKMVVSPVLPVAPVAPVLPVAPVAPINTQDHDLLQRLDQKVDGLKVDIKAINDGTSYKTSDHEKRIRANETSITQIKTYGIAIMLFIGILETLILKFLK